MSYTEETHERTQTQMTIQEKLEEHKELIMTIQNVLIDRPIALTLVLVASTAYFYALITANFPPATWMLIHILGAFMGFKLITKAPLKPLVTTKGPTFNEVISHAATVIEKATTMIRRRMEFYKGAPTRQSIDFTVVIGAAILISWYVPVWAVLAFVWYPAVLCPSMFVHELPQKAWVALRPLLSQLQGHAMSQAKMARQRAFQAAKTHEVDAINRRGNVRRDSVRPASPEPKRL